MCMLCFVLCVVVNNTLGQLARRQPAGLFTCLTPESDQDECPRERESVLLYIVIHVLYVRCMPYICFVFCICMYLWYTGLCLI